MFSDELKAMQLRSVSARGTKRRGAGCSALATVVSPTRKDHRDAMTIGNLDCRRVAT
jgi:hypothetical protein